MVPRYARPAMTAIWEPEARYSIWFEIEAHATDRLGELGVVPKSAGKALWDWWATEPAIDVAETTAVVATPALTTRVSAQSAAPGSTITDSVVVSGSGSLRLVVSAELYGPFETRAEIRCDGTPAWRGTLEAEGDGTYRTAPFRVESPGYYTYREAIVAGPANEAVATECGEEAETTLARARPVVSTVASSESRASRPAAAPRISPTATARLRAVTASGRIAQSWS